jgi:hypothetical protein
MFVGDIANTVPYVGAILFVMVLIWMFAVFKLGKIIDVVATNSGENISAELAVDSETIQPKIDPPSGKNNYLNIVTT